jgi:hypothetical protein
MSKFKDYYQIFLNNVLKREKYKITFDDDTELTCVPTCGSFQKPNDNVEFSLIVEDTEGNKHNIKKSFSSIKNL